MPTGVYKRKPFSEEHKKNMSKALSGKNNPMYGRVRSREKSPTWKGGRVVDSAGYILIKKRDHPQCDCHGYVFEHRLVYEEYHKCCLLRWGLIHHINGNKQDNHIENLLLVSRARHTHIEHIIRISRSVYG